MATSFANFNNFCKWHQFQQVGFLLRFVLVLFLQLYCSKAAAIRQHCCLIFFHGKTQKTFLIPCLRQWMHRRSSSQTSASQVDTHTANLARDVFSHMTVRYIKMVEIRAYSMICKLVLECLRPKHPPMTHEAFQCGFYQWNGTLRVSSDSSYCFNELCFTKIELMPSYLCAILCYFQLLWNSKNSKILAEDHVDWAKDVTEASQS